MSAADNLTSPDATPGNHAWLLLLGTAAGDRECTENDGRPQRNRRHRPSLLFENEACLCHAEARAAVLFG